MRLVARIAGASLLSAAAAGCTLTSKDVRDPTAGFSTVSMKTEATLGKSTVWIQNSEEAKAAADKVKRLSQGQVIGADTAVQIALLNNKGLQAAYAEIGLSAAEVWQESLLENPRVSIGVTGIDAARTIEAAVVTNILALMTRPRRVALADTRFRQAQLRAAEGTLALAASTRRAWIDAVFAREKLSYLNQAEVAADAASALAKKLGESGAFTKTGQAREHVFYAELAGETARARLEARQAKEALTRLMGLWGYGVDYKLPGTLPALPKGAKAKRLIEAEALQNRVDLEIARLELEAMAQSYGLTQATRFVSDLEVLAGVEIEREGEEGGATRTSVSANAEVEFVIPIFDTGKARLRKAEFSYMQAANLLAEKAVNIRSEARAAYDAYRSTYDIARHYRNSVIPLRTKIAEESLLTYNGMITNTFELLADTRAKLDSIVLSLNAKREFWLADVNLLTVVHGGGTAAASGGGEEGGSSEASAGH